MQLKYIFLLFEFIRKVLFFFFLFFVIVVSKNFLFKELNGWSKSTVVWGEGVGGDQGNVGLENLSKTDPPAKPGGLGDTQATAQTQLLHSWAAS